MGLRWALLHRVVDKDGNEWREARLGTSKSGRPRTLPLVGELAELIEKHWLAREYQTPAGPALSEHVFHVRGRPLADFRRSWATACAKAGLPGRRFHDLRRSGIRFLRRAGNPGNFPSTKAKRARPQRT